MKTPGMIYVNYWDIKNEKLILFLSFLLTNEFSSDVYGPAKEISEKISLIYIY